MALLVKFATKFFNFTTCMYILCLYIHSIHSFMRSQLNFTVLTILPCASFAWDNLKTNVRP